MKQNAISDDFLGADDASNNPFEVLRAWMQAAEAKGETYIDAADLATVDADGLPNLRVVFVREIENNGLVFYTNYDGQKGTELNHPKAALNFYYKSLWWQMRVRGEIERVSDAQSDRYFQTRPLGSRKGAWASQQSRPLIDRKHLIDEWEAIADEKASQRPQNWGGYRLIPSAFEFWCSGEFRLHDRFQWQRVDDHWSVNRLYP